MPNANMMKSKFLGKPGNPFHQFKKFVLATSYLPPEVEKDPEFFYYLASELRTEAKPDASRKLLAYRIFSILNGLGQDKYKSAYSDFIFGLKKDHYWIEKSFSDVYNLNQKENTVFAPQPFHFEESDYSQEIKDHIRNRNLEKSRRALRGILNRIHISTANPSGERGQISKSIFYNLLNGNNQLLFDALSELHFEASDNASSHALRTDDNPNAINAEDQNFFGDAQYLQLSAISHSSGSPRRRSEWPNAIYSYVEDFLRVRRVKGRRFLLLSYVDNGPGIVEHISRFSRPSSIIPKSISEAIEGNVSTRLVDGAGDGLSNMREEIEGVDGFIFIQSGAHTHWFSGLDGKSQDTDSALSRGTLLTFVVPA